MPSLHVSVKRQNDVRRISILGARARFFADTRQFVKAAADYDMLATLGQGDPQSCEFKANLRLATGKFLEAADDFRQGYEIKRRSYDPVLARELRGYTRDYYTGLASMLWGQVIAYRKAGDRVRAGQCCKELRDLYASLE